MHNGRLPVFAVSASLVEREKDKYIDAGFDGWILKPVDFKRVNHLLKGIVDRETRNACVHEPGKWEQGGWFKKKENRSDMFSVSTVPDESGGGVVT
jgi:DNA-binding response OmpR family regulator